MIQPRLFLCGGAERPTTQAAGERRIIPLDIGGSDPNVHLRIEDVAQAFATDLTPRMADFLELAAYVFAADASTSRGSEWADEGTIEPWDRDFHFVIGVRDVDFWQSDAIKTLLKRTLQFLSDDQMHFDFVPLSHTKHQVQPYLVFGEFQEWPFHAIERVLMFSGGLDSLTGAVEAARQGQKLVLVSHRSVATLSARQVDLVKELRKTFPSSQVLHIPVWVNKSRALGREHTQRTRSFLFAALGTAVAQSVGAAGVRFFENGIVSINLPVADEVTRSRASRTTHPQSMRDLAEIASLVLQRPLVIDNPYIFKTKADVVGLLKGGAESLIGHTCSCAHTGFYRSKTQPHCGACSQCIDRRIATWATGLAGCEPEGDYETDVFTGLRKEGYEQNMAVNYVRHANELSSMSDEQIAAQFNTEISRAAVCFPIPRDAAMNLVQMHRRHGDTVGRVIEDALQRAAHDLYQGRLEPTSMLAMVSGQRHRESGWGEYAGRIVQVLSAGLPTIYRKKKPSTEPELQEICDGLLKSHNFKLRREYPFYAWGWSTTKPDWSDEARRLWLELKYIRQQKDVRTTTRAIAEDLTKYGDNSRRVLFIIYDPARQVIDEDEYSEPVRRRAEMVIRFIR
jgi:7-cyano-7-deazaguanine synthase in queuosine biosynthesis